MVTCAKQKTFLAAGLVMALCAAFSLPATGEIICPAGPASGLCAENASTGLVTISAVAPAGHIAAQPRPPVNTSVPAAPVLKPAQLLNLSATLLAEGQDTEALNARNTAINDWLASLSLQDVTQIDIRKSKGGVILAVNYSKTSSGQPVHALWLAVPDGPGLPAAAVLRPDPMRGSIRAVRTGRATPSLTILEQRTCHDARILRESHQPAAVESFDRIASDAMRAYLRASQTAEPGADHSPPPQCRMPELMLHTPDTAF